MDENESPPSTLISGYELSSIIPGDDTDSVPKKVAGQPQHSRC